MASPCEFLPDPTVPASETYLQNLLGLGLTGFQSGRNYRELVTGFPRGFRSRQSVKHGACSRSEDCGENHFSECKEISGLFGKMSSYLQYLYTQSSEYSIVKMSK